jgi:hypothetical protein
VAHLAGIHTRRFGCNKSPRACVYETEEAWQRGLADSTMEITQEHRNRLEEVIRGVECPKGFVCYKSGFTRLGKVAGIKKDGFLECLEEDCQECQFSLPFGKPTACLCPVRIYIANEFAK